MSFTYGVPGTPTYSVTYDTLDEMLAGLPNNSLQLIQALNTRNSVFTLWERINEVILTIGSVSFYTNPIPTTITVGGITQGSTFNNYTFQQVFTQLLYPYVSPILTLTSSNSIIEYGGPNFTTLFWGVSIGSATLSSIIVHNLSKTITGGNESGSQPSIVTQNVNTTFTMSVVDHTNMSFTASTQVIWENRRYWGTYATFSLPNNSEILNLNGASVGSGNELSNTRIQVRNGIYGSGSYLVFAWPTSFGTPLFVVDGVTNTAWTLIGNSISFTNQYSYVTNYDVWISNTAQNSPIDLFQID